MASTPTSQFFTDREAWNIFRLAAFGEAFGWTLLISGILWKQFSLPNGSSVLTVLGQTHGMLFFAYFAGLLAVATSLRMSRWQFVIAAAASVPPYGTLVYEKYLAHKRRLETAKTHREIVVRGIILDGKKLLAVQPVRGTFWCVPGGKVAADETAESSLLRHINELLGFKPKLGALLFTQEYKHHGQLRLEMFYSVTNVANMQHWQLTKAGRRQYDELEFINPKQTKDLLPEFLQRAILIK